MSTSIAVVGLACRYPDARTPEELWENALAGRRAFRRLPAERLSLADYFSADPSREAIYARQAAVLEGWEFDRVRFRVGGASFRAADLVHWLALEVADQALRDAGFPDGEGLPRESTGVLVGNTLTGEFSRAGLMRLRWPYVRRVLGAKLKDEGWDQARRTAFLERVEELYKAPFEPVGDETLAGGLSNTIAGRICNHFHLRGGGFTLDGACSSSLLAVCQAASALQAGDLDVALCGGVDLSLDPFELIGFAKAGALARGEMRVYDQRAAGFLPGEGCGFVVLMRADEARRRGLRVHALLRGWGFSSDGGGGITRPEVAGQGLALERAYRRAGYGIDSVALFEGHGTGTAVGDEVEVTALLAARARSELGRGPEAGGSRPLDPPPSNARISATEPAALGSVKALFGHTKAAAGIAGVLKAVLALRAQIQPPTVGAETPRTELGAGASSLRTLDRGRPWPRRQLLRAGVSSFGFGGINAHVALQAPRGPRRTKLDLHERRLLRSSQDAELLLFGGPSPAALLEQVAQVARVAPALSRAEVGDLAGTLHARLPQTQPLRAALVVASADELCERLETLRVALRAGATAAQGVWLPAAPRARRPRLALLFSGQGAPVPESGGAWARRFDAAALAWHRHAADAALARTSTAYVQPAILAAQVMGLKVLRRLGLVAHVAVGHSLGELAALHWAGACDAATLLALGRARGALMAAADGGEGAMASLGADAPTVERLLREAADARVVLACLNAARQCVVSGAREAVAESVRRAQAEGLHARLLDTAGAFHSPLMIAAHDGFRPWLDACTLRAPRRRVVSTIAGRELTGDDDLRALLARQLTEPVLFTAALARAFDGVDLALEVGPGQVLTRLASDAGRVPTLALDCGGPSLRGLLEACAAAHALGCAWQPAGLFDDRFLRPFDLERPLRFLVNPCELAPVDDGGPARATRAPVNVALAETAVGLAAQPVSAGVSALDVVKALVARKTELPLAELRDELRLARDLHLSSLAAGELVSAAARQLGLQPPASPLDYADAELREVAAAFERQHALGDDASSDEAALPPSLEPWVRAFVVESHPCARRAARQPDDAAPAVWRVLGDDDDDVVGALRARSATRAGGGVIVCLPRDAGVDGTGLLLEGARALLATRGRRRFVVVRQPDLAAAFVRTLTLEDDDLVACLVDPPEGAQAVDVIEAEVAAARGCAEVRYDEGGTRREPRLRLLELGEATRTTRGGGVLLVSGGGKGIGFECARELARQSGCALALLGRSRPADDDELRANLERLEGEGLRWRYVPCDVTRLDSLRRAVAEVEAELGPITGLLHAAGANTPRLASEIESAGFERTWAPKVRGFEQLLLALDTSHLRLLVTLGSVIGRFGLRGQAEYALANARLTWLAQRFQAAHPACRCLALESSVWAEVGMGVRLGRLDVLLRAGISPIPPREGAALVARLALDPHAPATVVISGRLGLQPPVPFADEEPLPFQRFLEIPRVFYPGVELVVEAELSTASDPYVADHVFEGEQLFPAVMGIEAMAQAAMALLRSQVPPRFRDVRLERPVSVPRDRPVRLRVLALARGREVEVALRTSESGFQADHFRAICVFDEPVALGALELVAPPPEPVALDPARDIYGVVAPHGPAFQRLRAYRQLEATRAWFEVEVRPAAAWFAPYLPQTLVLGDPGARDAALHGLQAAIPHGLLVPLSVGDLRPAVLGSVTSRSGPGSDRGAGAPRTIAAPELASGAAGRHAGRLQVVARESAADAFTFTWTLELADADGRVVERWSETRFRRLGTRAPLFWAEPLLSTWLTRRAREIIGADQLTVVVQRGAESLGRARTDLALQAAAGHALSVLRAWNGKPDAPDGPALSASHAGDVVLATAAPDVTACDVEPVVARSAAAWRDLLGETGVALAAVLARPDEPAGAAETRAWGARECLKKAGLPAGTPLTLRAIEPDGFVVLGARDLILASVVARLPDVPQELAFSLLGRPAACAPSSTATSSPSRTPTWSATSTMPTTSAGRAAAASTSSTSTLPM